MTTAAGKGRKAIDAESMDVRFRSSTVKDASWLCSFLESPNRVEVNTATTEMDVDQQIGMLTAPSFGPGAGRLAVGACRHGSARWGIST